MKYLIAGFILMFTYVNLTGMEFSEETWISQEENFSFRLPFDDYNYVIVEEAYNQESFYEVCISLNRASRTADFIRIPSVTFKVEPIDIISYENYFSYAAEALNYYYDCELIDSGTTDINGIKTVWITAELKPGEPFNPDYILKFKQYYLLEPNPTNPVPRAFFISYLSTTQEYDYYLSYFEEIVKSFRLI
ncbi:MAG: hypothetical protein APR63_11100 [Desulfuromonas sp. SDB]|nr:MAG: hypothetical protein APR63_11100 [Desulfuromonas sp. SDB]